MGLPLWTYGCNEHLDFDLQELPAGFEPAGLLKQDFPAVCKLAGVTPHPAFKLATRRSTSKQPAPVPQMTRRNSLGGRKPSVAGADNEVEEHAKMMADAAAMHHPVLLARSVLLDRVSMQILGLLVPRCPHLRQIHFADCRLDLEMLKLLRRGLQGSSTVEALQIQWNPLEQPLPAAESVVGVAGHEGSEATGAADGAEGEAAGGGGGGAASLELRERLRYRLQSQRCLRSFALWLTDLCNGSLEAAWAAMSGTPADKELTASDFHDLLEDCFGATGSHVAETFDVLDGPDYAGGLGRVSLASMRSALESLPQEEPGAELNDPIGLTIAEFVDGTCTLESLSLRACSLGWPEVAPAAKVLEQCPWQLRSLNFWSNRICDRGAAALASALEQYRGLEYLGLGRNRITDVGLAALCRPFHAVHLDEDGRKVAQDRIKEQQTAIDAKAKAQAKAKAAPKPAGRQLREPPLVVDELEERPPVVDGGEPSYVLRRPSELRVLVVSENPIKLLRTVETLQPLGPKGTELLLGSTPAAAALIAKRPDLGGKERKPFCPGGEGWVIRAA